MRLIIVVAVLVVVAALAAVQRRRIARAQGPVAGEVLPAELVDRGAVRTWVLVVAPWCASCGPVEERLRRVDAGAALVKLDAAENPELARRLQVRTAPTLLLADAEGRVLRRLAGAKAVNDHVATLQAA